MKKKLIRITTVSGSLWILLKGQLRFMNQFYHVIGIAGAKENMQKVRDNEGIDTIDLEMTRVITPVQDLSSLFKLYKVLKREKPFIVHTHTPKAGIVGMMAAKMAGVKHRLHTVAGLPLVEATGTKRTILNQVERLTYACATKVYPNSKGLEDIILEHKFTKPEKLKVLANGSSNGINTSIFSPDVSTTEEKEQLKNKLGIKPNDLILVFVGRIVRDKGINELMEAFHKLSKKYDHLKLLMVGPYEKDLDPISPEAEEEIATNKAIISLGWQDDVRPFFAVSDVLVFPSYREGFPNVVLQAGAMSLASIVSDINGCNEIIEEGINGTIIPVKDASAIEAAIEKMIENPEITTQMKNVARERIVRLFDQKKVWEAILQEYKNLEKEDA
ncbi:glycosyltransferase family 4 protein [Flavimarina sp. Hel_I_48]|uniref:glycosyltransferase family 4 protein n=1 Tax=Flavimarina sp. Hel_I_48 TaxID=1392488 RepID=UPI0004DF315C|nr:glycosyltransferase family 4 protein [Flavimarina sp. Hel_I_48]